MHTLLPVALSDRSDDYTSTYLQDKLASISTEAIPMLDPVQRHTAEQFVAC